VGAQLDAVRDGLHEWGGLARSTDAQDYAARLEAHVREGSGRGDAEAYLQALPPEMQWAGLDRYWRSRRG
jgi:hypothetical protein